MRRPRPISVHGGAHLSVRRLLDALYPPRAEILRPADDVIVCRCEEIRAGSVRAVVGQGCLGPTRRRRCCAPAWDLPGTPMRTGGERTDRRRERGVAPREVGYYRIRAPLKPITLGELVAAETT